MVYLPLNVDFITLTVTSHWGVGFCMYACKKCINIYAVMCKPCRSIASIGEVGLRDELGARLQTIVLYSMFCGTCLELPQVIFV